MITGISHEGTRVRVKKENMIREIGWIARNRRKLYNNTLSFPPELYMTEGAFLDVIKVILGQEPTITHVNRTELYRIARKLEIHRLVQQIEADVDQLRQKMRNENQRRLNNTVRPQVGQEPTIIHVNRIELHRIGGQPEIHNMVQQIEVEGIGQQTRNENQELHNNTARPQVGQERQDVGHQSQTRDQTKGNIRLYVQHNRLESHADIPKSRVLERLRYFETHRSELNTSVLDMSQKLSPAQFGLLVRDLQGETIEITDSNVQDIMHICAVYQHEDLERRLASEFQSILEAQRRGQGLSRYLTWTNAAIAVAIGAGIYLGVVYFPGMFQALLNSKAAADWAAAVTRIVDFLKSPEFKTGVETVTKAAGIITAAATAIAAMVKSVWSIFSNS